MTRPPPIAILFALPDESGDFRRAMTIERHQGLGFGLTVQGMIDGIPIVVAHTGVGEGAAAHRTGQIIREHSPAALISAGFAGGLHPDARVGRVIFDPRGLEDLSTPAGALRGPIVTAPRILEFAADKAALARTTGAITRTSGALAVDMETEAIATTASAMASVRPAPRNFIPVVALRVISDPVDADLPVPMRIWFDERRQAPRPVSLVLYLLRRPSRIAPFARFVRGLAPARAALAEALQAFIPTLGKRLATPPEGSSVPLKSG